MASATTSDVRVARKRRIAVTSDIPMSLLEPLLTTRVARLASGKPDPSAPLTFLSDRHGSLVVLGDTPSLLVFPTTSHCAGVHLHVEQRLMRVLIAAAPYRASYTFCAQIDEADTCEQADVVEHRAHCFDIPREPRPH